MQLLHLDQDQPCVFDNFPNWPAHSKWNAEYLSKKLGDGKVSVEATPTGRGDALVGGVFVMPDTQSKTFAEFLEAQRKGKAGANRSGGASCLDGDGGNGDGPAVAATESTNSRGVYYISHQNSSLTDEFPTLLEDAEKEIPWASEVFGAPPDAVNVWVGDEQALTTLHKDHYENIYCVVKGQKHFTLYPPTEEAFLHAQSCRVASYKQQEDGSFKVIGDDGNPIELGSPAAGWAGVEDPPSSSLPSLSRSSSGDNDGGCHAARKPGMRWIAANPANPDYNTHPRFKHATAINITVHAGQALYLPSLWFHQVGQTGAADCGGNCIAVNYWYDMKFDSRYAYFKFAEETARATLPE